MMKFGDITLNYRPGTLSRAHLKAQEIHHFPGTDMSDAIYLGRKATEIRCLLITKNDADRILIEQLLDSNEERDLQIYNFFYKRVVSGSAEFRPVKPITATSSSIWTATAFFIALNPIPYSIATGEAMY